MCGYDFTRTWRGIRPLGAGADGGRRRGVRKQVSDSHLVSGMEMTLQEWLSFPFRVRYSRGLMPSRLMVLTHDFGTMGTGRYDVWVRLVCRSRRVVRPFRAIEKLGVVVRIALRSISTSDLLRSVPVGND